MTVEPSMRLSEDLGTHAPALTCLAVLGRRAPSTRVRVTDWLDFIGLQAREVYFDEESTLRFSRNWRRTPRLLARHRSLRHLNLLGSHLLLSREFSPFSRGELERRLLRAAGHAVYDFDDALFADVGSLTRRAYGKAVKWGKSVRAADVVIAGNDYLADMASLLSDRVVMIPSCVDPSRYTPKARFSLQGPPTLVWLGSSTTEQYLLSIAGPLTEVHRRTGARLRLVSAPRDDEHPQIAAFTDRVPWSEEAVAPALTSSDVALAPLPDDHFTRGKCAYKVLQYAATALPIVGSPVGANASAIRQSDGLLVDTPEDWVDAVCEVIAEPEAKRRARGHAGLNAVQDNYSFAGWRDTWVSTVLGE